jgi:hypothetical protein
LQVLAEIGTAAALEAPSTSPLLLVITVDMEVMKVQTLLVVAAAVGKMTEPALIAVSKGRYSMIIHL